MQAILEELTALALQHLPHAVLIADREGGIIFRSVAAKMLVGDGPDVSSVLCSGQMPLLNWQQQIGDLDVSSGTAKYPDVGIRSRSGGSVTADVALTVLCRDVDTDIATAVLIAITETSERRLLARQRASAERLSAADEAIGRLVHELSNPLDGVLRYIGLAESAEPAGASEYLGSARRGLRQMAEVLDRYRTEAEPRHALGELLGEAISAFAPRAEELGVQVVCDYGDEGSAAVDYRLFQVICNVIKNALDAMTDGGRLEIRLVRNGRWRMIEFADTGRGLGADEGENIFDAFYTTKPAGTGSGLGLTISRDLVRGMGGTISAANCPGAGAVVTIRLPVGSDNE